MDSELNSFFCSYLEEGDDDPKQEVYPIPAGIRSRLFVLLRDVLIDWKSREGQFSSSQDVEVVSVPIVFKFILEYLGSYRNYVHQEDSDKRTYNSEWFNTKSPVAIITCVAPLIDVLEGDLPLLWISSCLRLVYIFARDVNVYQSMKQMRIFTVIEQLMQKHRNHPMIVAPCCMAMGNIAFHERSAQYLYVFFRLSMDAMELHINNNVVADSALWMIANYFSSTDDHLRGGEEAIDLIGKCMVMHPTELKLSCECSYALFNLCCQQFSPYRPFLIRRGILELLLDRLLVFRTTEFLIPAFDVIACLAHEPTAAPILRSRMSAVVAVRIPNYPIVNHEFKSTSSFTPQADELVQCTHDFFHAIFLEELRNKTIIGRRCLGVAVPYNCLVQESSLSSFPSLFELAARKVLGQCNGVVSSLFLPERIKDQLRAYVKCTSCSGYCGDFHASAARLKKDGRQESYSLHWICSSNCFKTALRNTQQDSVTLGSVFPLAHLLPPEQAILGVTDVADPAVLEPQPNLWDFEDEWETDDEDDE